MVSYPESTGSTLTLPIRRPPSVTSTRTSTTRRHRSHRSHYGGSSTSASHYQPQNEFPVFTHTGDVEIIIRSNAATSPGGAPNEKRYLLHRLILTQCSGFFEASTSEAWSKADDASPQVGPAGRHSRSNSFSGNNDMAVLAPKKKWRYELDWGREDDMPMLVQKQAQSSIFGDGDTPQRPPPARNKPPAPHSGFFRSMANFSTLNVPQSPQDPVDEIFRDYDNLFRIFYNYPPVLDNTNIAVAYVECKSLLQLADMYDAIEVIGPRVDHHLLRFQARLFKQIAKYPPSYLKLGYLARSKVIFSEALIHVVGQWPAGANQLRGQIPDSVIELIEDKYDDMEELKSKIEGRLFRLTLTTSRGERITPSNHWLDWLSMSLFRQWLAENTTPPPVSILKDPSARRPSHSHSHSRTSSFSNANINHPTNGHPPSVAAYQQPPSIPFNTGRVFRLLGTAGSAYLPREELKRFLKLNPEQYTRENMKRFERRMEELKNMAADLVKPLMRNFLELDIVRDVNGGGVGILGANGVATGGLPYLTCTKVDDRDFPWEE